MTINKRITGRRKLPHHKLFGSLETPPLGYTRDGFTFSKKEYDAAAAAELAKGRKPAEVHRELGRIHGPKAWLYQRSYILGMVLVPKHIHVKPPMSADSEFSFNEHNRIIAGWWYDRHRGYGPTNTVAAWFATKVGYISEGKPKLSRRYLGGDPHNFRDTVIFLEPPRCVGVNPYIDYQFVGEFRRPVVDYPGYIEEAKRAILNRFYKHHKIGAKA